MPIRIRPMTAADTEDVLAMMQIFYASPAVYTNGSEEIFRADIAACVGDNPYLEGFVLEVNGQTAGYAMLAKSFSTEFGRACIWMEDLFIKDTHRGHGLGTAFVAFVRNRYPDALLRLEVEEENEHAVYIYRKAGFDVLPYMEMKRSPDASCDI